MNTTRRTFFLHVVALAAVPIGAGAVGCGDDDGAAGGGSGGGSGTGGGAGGGGSAPDGGTCSDVAWEIVAGPVHTHAIELTASDVIAGTAGDFAVTGGHTHQISLTAEQLDTLAAGGTVTVTSTEGATHTHDFQISCAF